MWAFFPIGILSAIALRFLIVFYHINPSMMRPVWYVGVVGYTLFFLYRYSISRKRKRAVVEFRLMEKVSRGERLEGPSQKAAEYLFKSVVKSKEDINYLVIFVLSIGTIFIDLMLQSGNK